MEIDFRPLANDITLCTNAVCPNKCKRWHENWKPNNPQSYINPNMVYDKNGILKECEIRMK